MKSILLSIKPEWLAKILNGEKTIEVRKKFPKDYVGWVYLYCSKSKPYLTRETAAFIYGYDNEPLNGKVVARFWCDKVEDLIVSEDSCGDAILEVGWGLIEQTCLTEEQICRYVGKYNNGFAIHISKLEIFDRPKELREFRVFCEIHKNKLSSWTKCKNCPHLIDYQGCSPKITKAPQNYCYIEGE